MSTVIQTFTIEEALNSGDPAMIANALRIIKAGKVLSFVRVTVAGLTAAAAVDITAAATKAAATVVGLKLDAYEQLPAIGVATGLRATAVGTGALGCRVLADSGATPVAPAAGGQPGVATLSADGKTITFEGTVTGFVLEYIPRGEVALSTVYPTTP